MPKSKKQWVVNLTSEFFGSIFLIWMIGVLGVTFGSELLESKMSYGSSQWISRLVIGWWVALDVAICLILFSRWSCDLNPAVTLYRLLAKQNIVSYALAKFFVQFLGAFAAAGLIIGTQSLSYQISGNVLDSISNANSTWSSFLANANIGDVISGSTFLRHFIALIGETTGGFILLWPIFTKSIKSSLMRDLVLILTIGFGVAALLEIKTVGWNPARALATNFAYDISKGGAEAMKIYWAHFTGPLLGAIILWALQKGDFVNKLQPLWTKWLSLGTTGPIANPNDKNQQLHFENNIKFLNLIKLS